MKISVCSQTLEIGWQYDFKKDAIDKLDLTVYPVVDASKPWQTPKVRTTCKIYRDTQVRKDNPTPLATGTALCSPKDAHKKDVGRMVSLERACVDLAKALGLESEVKKVREEVFHQYFRRVEVTEHLTKENLDLGEIPGKV